MLDLRRQLQDAGNERATLVAVQRQNRSDILAITEARDLAAQEAAALQQELILCKNQLKASLTPSHCSLLHRRLHSSLMIDIL